MEALRIVTPDFDPMVEDEICLETAPDEHGVAEVPQEWRPTAEDEARAGGYMRAYRYHLREQERVARLAQAERLRIEAWERRCARQEEQALAYLRHMLELYLRYSGQHRINLPSGTVGWQKGRERVEVSDPADFCTRYKGTPLVRVRMEPDKAAIMDAVKHGHDGWPAGTLPEGAEIVRGEDAVSIKPYELEVQA